MKMNAIEKQFFYFWLFPAERDGEGSIWKEKGWRLSNVDNDNYLVLPAVKELKKKGSQAFNLAYMPGRQFADWDPKKP